MAKIQINAAARRAVHDNVTPGKVLRETSIQIGPDLWEVELDPETVRVLDKWRERLKLQSYSDVILWLAAHRPGLN